MSKYKSTVGKIGIGIVAFEGTEHLYNIISEMRRPKTSPDDSYDLVDTVVICLQEVGYDDNRKISNIDLNECIRLRDEDGLVDEIMFADLDTSKLAREQETDKRNFIIDKLKNDYGCDYALIMDSDEYYSHMSFERACKYIEEHNSQITYCQYCNYFGIYNPDFAEYSYRMLMKYPYKEMYVPFLVKTDYKFEFDSNDVNIPSDPTRRVKLPGKTYEIITDEKTGKKYKKPVFAVNREIIPWNVCKMHHLSWLRADIRKKLESWSSKKLFKNYDDLIDKAVYHFKHFDPREPNTKALMLFNTPGHKIDIYSMDRQYIAPKCDYRTRLRPAKDYKKLLVLSMSANMEPFNTLEQVSNETWRNIDHKRFPDVAVDFWTYTDAKPGAETTVDMNNHIIYIKRDSETPVGLEYTYSKTVEAFNIILNKLNLQFDYLIRTNNSTWLNIPLINEILAYIHDDSLVFCGELMSAFWSAYNPYGIGNLLIFSRRQMMINQNLFGTLTNAKQTEKTIKSMDDNLIGAIMNNRLGKLGIPYSDVYHSIGCKYFTCMKLSADNIDFTYPAYQVKTLPMTETQIINRTSIDAAKMKSIDHMWRDSDVTLDELYARWKDEVYDKSVTVIKETKEEYYNIPKFQAERMRFNDANIMERAEAFKFIPDRQKEVGYLPGIF